MILVDLFCILGSFGSSYTTRLGVSPKDFFKNRWVYVGFSRDVPIDIPRFIENVNDVIVGV